MQIYINLTHKKILYYYSLIMQCDVQATVKKKKRCNSSMNYKILNKHNLS